MTKKRKLFIPALALLSSALMALGIVSAQPTETQVSAEETPYTVVNIEDVITTMDDVKWHKEAQNAYNPGNTAYTANQAIYTATKADQGNDGSGYAYSKNDHEGNLSFYSTATTSAHALAISTLDSNELISYTTIFEPAREKETGWNTEPVWLKRQTSGWWSGTGVTNGYRIRCTHMLSTISSTSNGSDAVVDVGVYYDKALNMTANDFSDTTLTVAELFEAFNAKYGTSYTKISEILTEGDALQMTVGTYDVNDQHFITMKMKNLSTGYEIFDWTTEDISGKATFGTVTLIGTHADSRKVGCANVGRSKMIGGVTRPILSVSDYTATGSYNEDEALTVLADELASTGYALNSTEGVLQRGENVLPATYTGSYYGNTPYTWENVNVIVNAAAVEKLAMTIVDKDGATLKTDYVKAGDTYTLNHAPVGTKLIGFTEGENFYSVGHEITATADTTFTAICVDFETLYGAAVRMMNDETGYAGIRFTARISQADMELYGDKFVLKAAMLPTNLIEGAFDYNEAGAEVFAFTQANYLENGGDYEVNFGKTDILYSNFNRAFSAMAYLEVTYSNGTTGYICDYDEEENSRSIYDVARVLYANNEAAITANGVGLYSSDNVKYLAGYVNSVVDITINGETVADAEIGLDLAKAYTVTGSVADGTVTLTVAFAEELPANYFVGESLYVPVNVWNGNAYTRVTTPTVSYDAATNTATITFTVA